MKKLIFIILLLISILLYKYDVLYLYRTYEKHQDTPSQINLNTYRIDIEAKPVKDVKNNLSGLTWSETHHLLFAVINRPSEIIWLTPEGERIGSVYIPEIQDLEAIVWIRENLFCLGSEKEGIVYFVDIDINNKNYVVKSTIHLTNYTNPRNNGLEGLAWDEERQLLFVAKEKKPTLISKINNETNTPSFDELPMKDVSRTMKDISGLHYHTSTSSLLVLSDESKRIIELNHDGRIIDRMYLNHGWSGLNEDIPQAEGITLDSQGYLYIVSEPNLFYRFVKQ